MAKTAMKKYTITLGACGPTIIRSNVIKAHSKEEAVEKYISETGGEYTDAMKAALLSRTHEKISQKDIETADGVMYDYERNELQVGDCVAFICMTPNDKGFRRYNVQEGIITKMQKSSAEIFSEKMNKTYRVMVTSGSYTGNEIKKPRLKKVAKLFNKYESEDSVFADALGQSVHEGDWVAYMADIYQDSCPGFIKGSIQKVTSNFVVLEAGKRRTTPKFAVIQRNMVEEENK